MKIKKRTKQSRRESTRAIHAGERTIENAVASPVFQTATFSFADSASVRRYQESKYKTRAEYGRYGSPTQNVLEDKLTDLYGAEAAVVTSSGMSAILVTLLTLLEKGGRLVMSAESYGGTRVLTENILARFGVQITFVEPRAEAFIKALRTKATAVFVEFPTNPYLRVPDLPRIAAAARRRGTLLLVDATLAGAFAVDPIAHGADLVLLSLTKYVAGHHDVIAGAVLGRRRIVERIRETHGVAGTLLAPAAVQLVLRGIKTLPLRMRRHHENGRRIAAYLAAHPRVREVFHPSLPGHPDHAVAKRLMRDFGGVVSFRIRGNLRTAEAFLDRLRIFRIAPSLGGAESLAESVPTMAFWRLTRAERLERGITDDLIRLAVGLEDPEDLIADLEEALRGR